MADRFKNVDFDAAETVLAIDGLCVDLEAAGGARKVLDNVSLRIRQGETACLVGESGSGKSLTSLAIMGLLTTNVLRVSAGSIVLRGTELLTRSKREIRNMRGERMSMIFQEPMTALNPVMRVGDQIAEVLQSHGAGAKKEMRRRVLDIMEQVHLPDVERIYRSYPHQLSGGQRQRIMIAMALILEPALLIADEPTTALDVSVQAQILNLLKDLQSKLGLSYLFISHNLAVVDYIAERILVMCRGMIVEEAPREKFRERARHPYTRALLAAVPEPDLDQPMDLDMLTSEKTSDPGSWPEPYRVMPESRPVRQEIAPGHFVLLGSETADITGLVREEMPA